MDLGRVEGREGGMSDEARTALERAVRMWARIEDDRVYLGVLVNRAEELGASVPEFVRGTVGVPKAFNHEEAGIEL